MKNKIINLKKEGFTTLQIANKLNIGLALIELYTKGYPTAKTIKKLNNHPEFEKYFKKIYSQNDSIVNITKIISQHSLFERCKFNQQRLSELRKFYNVKPKMFENNYSSETDRIKGYIIRQIKSSAKRRNIEFDLHYTDFQLPVYCPLLNIKLTYLKESSGNAKHHATLDRIDNNKGYIKGNVIVISRLANSMKNSANFDELNLFIKNIKKLIDFYKNQDALGDITDLFLNIELKT